MKETVVVVTISESFPLHGHAVSLRCFSSNEKAAKWIEKQIEERVRTFHFDREAAVDGWFVKLEGEEHSIQYDVHELEVE